MMKLIHIYRRATSGPHGNVVAGSFAAILVVIGLVLFGIIEKSAPALPVLLSLLAVLVVQVVLIILIGRLRGRINDVGYAVSLEGGLMRAGYNVTDLFTDGAAANPSLQLLH